MDFFGGSPFERVTPDVNRPKSRWLPRHELTEFSFSRSVLSFPCNVACRSTKRLQAAQKASYEVPSPVHIKHPHAMVPNMWLHPRHFIMVSGGCLILDIRVKGLFPSAFAKKGRSSRSSLSLYLCRLCPAWNGAEETMDKTMEKPSISKTYQSGGTCWCLWQASGPFSSTSGCCAGKSSGTFQLVPPGNENDQNSLPWSVMSVTILPSRSNIEISNAQQIETIETLEMKIESTHVARALSIAWMYLSGRHFVLFWDLLVCDTVGMAWNVWTLPFWEKE